MKKNPRSKTLSKPNASGTSNRVTELRLGNFKAFGKTQSIPVRPITLIFGANSAGKSSILESLVFANEAGTKVNGLRKPLNVTRTVLGGSHLDLGGFGRFVHSSDNSVNARVTWGMDVSVPKGKTHMLGASNVGVTIAFGRIHTQAVVSSLNVVGEPLVENQTAIVLCPIELKIRVDGRTFVTFKVEHEGPEIRSAGTLYRLKKIDTKSDMFRRLLQGAWRTELGDRGDFGEESWIAQFVAESTSPNGFEGQSIAAEFEGALVRALKKVTLYNASRGLLDFRCVDFEGASAKNKQLALTLAVNAFSEFVVGVLPNIEAVTRALVFVGPVRQLPLRNNITGEATDKLDSSGGDAQYATLAKDSKARERTNYWLERLRTELEVRATYLVETRNVEPALSLSNLGLLQVSAIEVDDKLREIFRDLSTDELLLEFEQKIQLINTQAKESFGLHKDETGVHYAGSDSGRKIIDAISSVSPRGLHKAIPAIASAIASEESLTESATYLDLLAAVTLDRGEVEAVASLWTKMLLATLHEGFGVPRVTLRDTRSDIDLEFGEVGTGISQVVPVIVSLLSSRGQLVTVEQPELHLHPRLQADVGDLLIEAALGPVGNTVLAETHSEHLILRILRRIRETSSGKTARNAIKVSPEDVCILYVEKGKSGSVVRHIEVTKDGAFKSPWPDGFFEERLEELF